jgi:hypothetical protein
MWFTIIKIKPFTGKGAIQSKAKRIIIEYLSTVGIGHEFFSEDVLDYAQVNSLKGIKYVGVGNIGHQLRKNMSVKSLGQSNNRIRWIKVK